MGNFKYSELINKIKDCPAAVTELNKASSFRWVFSDINDSRNFLPPGIQKPKRFNDSSDLNKCKSYGLSFFNSLEKCTSYFLLRLAESPQLHKTVGDRIANGILDTGDGRGSKPDDFGHFSFYEFVNINLSEKFSIVETLKLKQDE